MKHHYILFACLQLCLQGVICLTEWEQNCISLQAKLDECIHRNQELEEELVYAAAFGTSQSLIDLSNTNYDESAQSTEDHNTCFVGSPRRTSQQ